MAQENTLEVVNISKGTLNKSQPFVRQDFYITDSDDTVAIGIQMNEQFVFERPSTYRGKVIYIEENISDSGESVSWLKSVYQNLVGEQPQSPKMAFVYIDQVHDDIKQTVKKSNLTRVTLLGDAAAKVVENSIIEMSFSNNDYSVGTFLRYVGGPGGTGNPGTSDGGPVNAVPRSKTLSQFCQKPSTSASKQKPSGNSPAQPSQQGTLPKTDTPPAPAPAADTKPSPKVDACAELSPPPLLKKPLPSEVPGVKFEQVFYNQLPKEEREKIPWYKKDRSRPVKKFSKKRNKYITTYPHKIQQPPRGAPDDLKRATAFCVHISAGGKTIDQVVRVLNKKNLNVHFLIGINGEVIQGTPLTKQTWAQNFLNGRAISFEVINPSLVGIPDKKLRYKLGPQVQLEALWQTILKVQKFLKEQGVNIPLRCMEKQGDKFLFGILPYRYEANRKGIVAHGSCRQVNPVVKAKAKGTPEWNRLANKQHSDGRPEVYYCQLRALGASPDAAYKKTLQVISELKKSALVSL